MTDFAMLKFSLVTDKSLMDLEVYGSPLTLLEPMATVPYTEEGQENCKPAVSFLDLQFSFLVCDCIIICRAINAVTATD